MQKPKVNKRWFGFLGPFPEMVWIAIAVLLATPGPAVLYIIARSIDQGRTAGFVSVLGMAVGGAVHVLAAAGAVTLAPVPYALNLSKVDWSEHGEEQII